MGILIYSGPYSSPSCPHCGDKPARADPPPGSVEDAVASYKDRLYQTASHPSHVIFILGNEFDIAGGDGGGDGDGWWWWWWW